ncbi:serine/threonine-protein phosphatase 4 regulatory subunit 1 isoform X2 [Dendroctonus ponderosae]|uniref:serine/threonine-protein phosphatase 4 regulatory subunit 1 isoform X2 n=1 Tax=Dendroctonus ponderosae TaxID=77166 RepID=UPI0020355594|nr:serine/threonine-protein phosphatase 4 regulatory subunit 1 isoform X2 [Dendroctonus ponderosae]
MAGADISLTYDDCPDDLTDKAFEQGDCSRSSFAEEADDDNFFNPLERIQQCLNSTDSIIRQCLASLLQNIFKKTPSAILTKELPEIMRILTKVTDDDFLQENFLEKIPSIAAEALANSDRVEALKDVIGDYLLPVVVRNLGWSETGINLAAKAVLVEMMEKGYVTQFQAEVKVCPAILALQNQLDVNTSAITLMSKFIRLLGKDIAERILMKRFIELCSSHLFYVRKLAAWQFGHYCAIVGSKVYEESLLPCYLALCEDDMWTVRKACAEVITFVSCVCPSELRKSLLAPAFGKLLRDKSKWVRTSACQTLGGFIATFADPPSTKIAYDISGDLVLMNLEGDYFIQPPCKDGFSNVVTMEEAFMASSTEDGYLHYYDDLEKGACNEVTDLDSSELGGRPKSCAYNSGAFVEALVAFNDLKLDGFTTEAGCSKENGNANSKIETETKNELDGDLLAYNQHNYWYISPPELDLNELELTTDGGEQGDLNESSEDVVICHAQKLPTKIELGSDEIELLDDRPNSVQPCSDNKGDNLDNIVSDNGNVSSSTTNEIKGPTQTIVPQYLIDSFLSMANLSGRPHGNDMSVHCAYSMPAVISTLGREYWPLVKDTVRALACHLSYRIRRSVASSLCPLAVILGSEIASEDLSPLFVDFLADLDEVRIGVLNNLFDFLHLVTPQKRDSFAGKLGILTRMNSIWNWRFLQTFAEQLTRCVHLFSPADVAKWLGCMYAPSLLCEKVAEVRLAAIVLVSEVLKRTNADLTLSAKLLTLLSKKYAHGTKWRMRQTFVLLCTEILKREALSPQDFASAETGMLSDLLELSWDPVVNIRLGVANCIVKHLITNDYFVSNHLDALSEVLRRYEADKERDVRMAVVDAV